MLLKATNPNQRAEERSVVLELEENKNRIVRTIQPVVVTKAARADRIPLILRFSMSWLILDANMYDQHGLVKKCI